MKVVGKLAYWGLISHSAFDTKAYIGGITHMHNLPIAYHCKLIMIIS